MSCHRRNNTLQNLCTKLYTIPPINVENIIIMPNIKKYCYMGDIKNEDLCTLYLNITQFREKYVAKLLWVT